MMDNMSGQRSKVREGFPDVFQHDLPLEPNQIGGPVCDLQGRVLGLNIARAGRIKTYALPASLISQLVEEAKIAEFLKVDKKPEGKAKTDKADAALAK